MNQPESCRATDAPSADVLYAAVHILECPFGVDRPYHYYIPRPLADAVRPGAFVTVPFGKGNRKKLALAVEICDRAGLSALPDGLDPDKFKPVSGVCRARLFLTEGQLALCRYLTAQTLCTVGEAVRTLVPAQALATLAEFYRPVPGAVLPAERLPAAGDLLIYEYIRTRGSVSAQALRTRFGTRAAAVLDMLTERGLVERELAVREPDERQENFFVLARPAEEIRAALAVEKGAGRIASAAQRTVLGVLLATRYALQSLGQKVLPLFSSVIELVGKVIFVLVFIPKFQYNAVILCEPIIWFFMTAYLVAVYLHEPFVFPKK